MLAGRDDASNQVLVLRWGAEQLEGARQALNAARAALKKLKAIEKKRKQKVNLCLAPCFWLSCPLLISQRAGAPKQLQHSTVQRQGNMRQAACSFRDQHCMALPYT